MMNTHAKFSLPIKCESLFRVLDCLHGGKVKKKSRTKDDISLGWRVPTHLVYIDKVQNSLSGFTGHLFCNV